MRTRGLLVRLAVLVLAACGTDIDRVLDGTQAAGGSAVTAGAVEALSFSHESGYYPSPISVTVTTPTPEVTVFCTRDGREPTENALLFAGPIRISRTTLLKCRGFRRNFTPSPVGEKIYAIEGTEPEGGVPRFRSVKIEMSLAVDGVEKIRVRAGVMELVHVKGDRPEDPLVKLKRTDGRAEVIDRWNLSPFRAEEGIRCSFASGECVSAPLDLRIPDLAAGGFGYIPPSSLSVNVGRGTVKVDGANQLVIEDGPASWSGYWFVFHYRYTAAEP